MMRSLICLILLCCSISSSANELRSQRLKLEYDRMMTQDSVQFIHLTTRISSVLIAQGRFEDAHAEMHKYAYAYRSKVDYAFKFTEALSAFYIDSFNLAQKKLNEAIDLNGDTLLQDRLLQIFCLNYSGQWQKAQRAMQRINEEEILNKADLDSSYASVQEMKYKDPRMAKLLSAFVPGLGQAYAGRVGRGIASFFLVGASVAYLAVHVVIGYYVTAALTGGLLTLRFYQGGKAASVRYAQEHNTELIRINASLLNQQLWNSLSDQSEGLDLLQTKLSDL